MYLKRFGYLKCQDNTTGFLTDDEQDDKYHKDPLLWLNSFNSKMLQTSIKLLSKFPDEATRFNRVYKLINEKGSDYNEIIKKKKNGWRSRRSEIGQVMNWTSCTDTKEADTN